MKTCLAILISGIWSISSLYAQTPGLIAVFNSNTNNVSLKWQHTDEGVLQYSLQRSGNNSSWTDIFKYEASTLKKNKVAKFTDTDPGAGKSYYRLKILNNQNKISNSSSILVIIGRPGNNWIMYPVPVRSVINLQYNGSQLIPGVITVFIRTMKGQILHRLRLASTTRLISIPVDNLGRGTYDIQIIINNEIVWNQRFLK